MDEFSKHDPREILEYMARKQMERHAGNVAEAREHGDGYARRVRAQHEPAGRSTDSPVPIETMRALVTAAAAGDTRARLDLTKALILDGHRRGAAKQLAQRLISDARKTAVACGHQRGGKTEQMRRQMQFAPKDAVSVRHD